MSVISVSLSVVSWQMNTLPPHYGDIYEGFFRYLPVVRVSLDEAGDDDEQENEHVDRSEDFVDPGRFLHPKRQEPWTTSTKTTAV